MPQKASVLSPAKHWLRQHPRLYDLSLRARRMAGYRTPTYVMLSQFSSAHKRRVRFIQIGASDGLHSDPIREFVVRDRWTGILVEPLPDSFVHLKRNYSYLRRRDLTFVNAALTTSSASVMKLWTFNEHFLDRMSEEEALDYARKSSFHRDYVIGHAGADGEEAVVEITVSCLTFSDLVSQYLSTRSLDLLVTDMEGYEATFIPTIDFNQVRPTGIFYESHNLGEGGDAVNRFLTENGYCVFDLGGDSFAVQSAFVKIWREMSAWASRNLVGPTGCKKTIKISPRRSSEMLL